MSPRWIARRIDSTEFAVVLSGNWKEPPESDLSAGMDEPFETSGLKRVRFDAAAMTGWGTGLLVLVVHVADRCDRLGLELDLSGLPEGAQRLTRLARASAKRSTGRKERKLPVVARVGVAATRATASVLDFVDFIGEVTLGLGRLARGKARFPVRDFLAQIELNGPGALGIVLLINFLVGLILAFVGALQLQQFGAQIFVADLVGVGMTREMAAMMTAIILTGRSGASFAAELGTMMVNEEIDALRTTGIPPIDYLVLPRLLALVLVMPFLALFADFVGILGGMIVGRTMLDIGFTQYFEQTRSALGVKAFGLGIVKATVYGMVVALVGCYAGMRCGRSASAVGFSVTRAVVMGIVGVIIASAVTTIVYSALGL